MARARMQSPAWPKDEILAEVDVTARLLFRDLHGIADKEGRLEDRPRWIQVETMPYDDVTADDVVGLLDQLEARGYIRRYTVEGAKFIEIPSFLDTQKPHPREAHSGLPAPSAGAYTQRLAQGEPKANLGGAKATPRWPVSKSVSKSVPKSESDSVPESDSDSESETVPRASRARLNPAVDGRLKDLARRILREHPNEKQDVLIDTLQWTAKAKFKIQIKRREAITYLQAAS